MQAIPILIGVLVATTALAGCTQAPPPSQQGGTATAVNVIEGSYEEESAPNTNVTVCWHVAGSGSVPHTAIHYDAQSHPNAASFNDYKGGAAYPNNASAAVAVQLPGDFCTRIPVGTGDVYFRAHVIDSKGGNGLLSTEHEVAVRAGTTAILGVRFAGTPPASAAAGSNVTVCWNVTGTGRIPHTAIHSDTVSHPTATAFSAYAGAAYYPRNATSQVAVDLPGTFCSAVHMPMNGTLYLRAHAMIQPPGQLSPTEVSIAVANNTAPTGVATSVDWANTVPASAAAGSDVLVCWHVDGTGAIPHTAVHWDDQSHAAMPTATFQDYNMGAIYPDNATAASTVQLPGTFCSNLHMPSSGSVYMRAHIIDSTGGSGRLSLTEKAIAVQGY